MATGTVEKRSKKGWTLNISYGRHRDPETGKVKQVRKRIAIKGTKSEATKELHRILAAVNAGTYAKPTTITVGEHLDKWLSLRESELAPATLSSYRRVIRKYLLPAFGDLPLRDLQPLRLDEAYLRWRAEGKGEPTLGLIHQVLHTALRQAVRWDLLTRNVADNVDPPRVTREETTALSPDQVSHLLEVARDSAVYPLILTAFHTGLRRGELVALRWENVDLGAGVIYVEESLQRIDRKTLIRPPKTAKGRRRVSLDEETISVLHGARARQTENCEYVFAKSDGTPYTPSYISRTFHLLAARAGLTAHLHTARHTYASTALLAQVPMRVVQELIGHANLATTADTYTHVLDGLKTAAAEAIGNAYRNGEHQLNTKTPRKPSPKSDESRP